MMHHDCFPYSVQIQSGTYADIAYICSKFYIAITNQLKSFLETSAKISFINQKFSLCGFHV